MILYYLDTILPVHPIEVIPEAAYGAREPRKTGEGALELADVLGEDDLVDLGDVFILDYRQTVTVDWCLVTMYTFAVYCQGAGCNI